VNERHNQEERRAIAAAPATIASDVELGEMPESDTTVASTPGTAQGGALDGIVLENLSPQTRSAFEIDDSVKQGVVITRLDPQSNAARAGLRPGDVVLEMNRNRIDTPQRFQELYSKSKNRVLLLVNRHGSKLDEATLREELEGNICRCTGYHNIVKAVLDAAGRMKVAQAAE